eukprot:218955-Pelagomonas_calceolata.AAC.1
MAKQREMNIKGLPGRTGCIKRGCQWYASGLYGIFRDEAQPPILVFSFLFMFFVLQLDVELKAATIATGSFVSQSFTFLYKGEESYSCST